MEENCQLDCTCIVCNNYWYLSSKSISSWIYLNCHINSNQFSSIKFSLILLIAPIMWSCWLEFRSSWVNLTFHSKSYSSSCRIRHRYTFHPFSLLQSRRLITKPWYSYLQRKTCYPCLLNILKGTICFSRLENNRHPHEMFSDYVSFIVGFVCLYY